MFYISGVSRYEPHVQSSLRECKASCEDVPAGPSTTSSTLLRNICIAPAKIAERRLNNSNVAECWSTTEKVNSGI
ncbi:hypothetical protein PR048_013045 [Dryococelus australis]|uniref:Uncharacterized protein n=1 Tax=Dryococelus australis TaxID=614101 RepID=A0ABQ9HR21_9NEOP|nr:hypothetical protein PR048_013045 [Dryococelus australis]